MKKNSLITKIHKFLSRLDLRSALILLVMFLFISVLLGGHLPPTVSAQVTPGTATPGTETTLAEEMQITPIPSEYLATDTQTNGIVLGSVILVLIILGGTLSIMFRKNGSSG